ncbi:chromate efflux transporter [Puia dinghuensis]|uniref:chromate efflux transporter n=1 Tax=Puia dinghuensis TaxID=1792502 RepID=UPI00166595ED|nr:chromate efflux transporter [Puia dinghuensis]
MKNNSTLRQLAGLFTRLGLTAFGGPAAHIAMMQKEVVDRLHWMDHQHFLDLVGATNLIPGPNSTEMAIHIGYERGKWKGLLVAGCCFILPAVLITGVIAWLYQKYGRLPQVNAWIYGIKPAIIAIILAAAWQLAKKAVKSVQLGIIGALVFLAAVLGADEIVAMFGAGAITLLLYLLRRPRNALHNFFPLTLLQITFDRTNIRLFLIFLKIGAILYGSGYVLFGFLDKELVAKGLLSRSQLIDAIAVGQFTPGPVFSSVTFIGWQMGGWQGALTATVAIFLPSFLFVALLNPLMPRLRRSALFSAFLDGVNVASVAIIAAVCVSFGKAVLDDWRTVLIAILSAGVVFGLPKINSVFVVIGGSLLGYGLSYL